jgi:hypothetical protein
MTIASSLGALRAHGIFRLFRTFSLSPFLRNCIITFLSLAAICAHAQNPPGLATRIKSGSSLLGTPCNSSGGNTDFYIQISVGVFYCNAGSWQQLQNSGATATHNLLSATHPDTTPATVTRGAGIFGIGSSPTWSLVSAPSATNGYFKKNSSGDIVSSSGAAAGTGSCASHNFVTVDNADASPTCAQPALGDLQSIAADSVAQNASGSSAAPSAVAIPNCASDGAHALVYSTSTHGWTCSSITGGAGVAVQPIVPKSAGYTITTSDFSALDAFVFTCTGSCDVLLPASAPATNGQFVTIKNQGSTSIFVMPNGLNLDSSIAPLLIPPKYTARIWTDTANYFSGSNGSLGEQSSRRFTAIQAGNALLIAIGNSISTTGSINATSATSTEGFFESMASAGTTNSAADVVELGGLVGIASNISNARWSARFGMDDGSAGVTNIRAFFGLVDTSCGASTLFAASSVDALNCHMLIFRCSSSASDTNWMAVTGKNGSSGVTTASTGVTCDTSNHTFTIQEHGGNTAYFFIDGLFKVCIGSDSGCTSAGTHYPAFAAARSIAGLTTLNNAAKTVHFFWTQTEGDR